MTAALAAWAILKRLPWTQIATALAIIGLLVLLWRAPWAESRGFHKRDGEVAALVRDKATLTANVATLQDGIREQNTAILETQAAGDAKVQAGQKALIEAQRQNLSLAAQAAELRKSAGKTYAAGDPCQISPKLAKAVL